jgi:F-type H+-transporting ATPase subunit gamma
MQAYKQVKEAIDLNKQMKQLMQAYQEQAIMQINVARYSVVSSREFMQELTDIFFNVKTSYAALLKKLEKEGKATHTLTQKNGKEALVLLSSNEKFYGDIISRICRLFYERASTTTADLIIVGKEGKRFYDQTLNPRPYRYFEIPDRTISLPLLRPLLQTIIPYEQVMMFYGKFNNIVTQDPVEVPLIGNLPTEEEEQSGQENFLFEPSVEKIMEFFESQIFSLLFNQTVNEGKLARFASRIKAMEFAQTNLNKQLGFLFHTEHRIRTININKKQLQLFAGRSLWGKR